MKVEELIEKREGEVRYFEEHDDWNQDDEIIARWSMAKRFISDLKSLQEPTEARDIIRVKIKWHYCPVCWEDSSYHKERAYICEKCYWTDEHKKLMEVA